MRILSKHNVPTMEVKCSCGKKLEIYPTDLTVRYAIYTYTCPCCKAKNDLFANDLSEEFALILN